MSNNTLYKYDSVDEDDLTSAIRQERFHANRLITPTTKAYQPPITSQTRDQEPKLDPTVLAFSEKRKQRTEESFDLSDYGPSYVQNEYTTSYGTDYGNDYTNENLQNFSNQLGQDKEEIDLSSLSFSEKRKQQKEESFDLSDYGDFGSRSNSVIPISEYFSSGIEYSLPGVTRAPSKKFLERDLPPIEDPGLDLSDYAATDSDSFLSRRRKPIEEDFFDDSETGQIESVIIGSDDVSEREPPTDPDKFIEKYNLSRISFNAQQLVTNHPAIIVSPRKKFLWGLSCPSGTFHPGEIHFSRWRTIDFPTNLGKTTSFVWFGDAQNVSVIGTFNGWTRGQTVLQKIELTQVVIFACVLKLAADSTHEFKFIVDGEESIDPELPVKNHNQKGQVNWLVVKKDFHTCQFESTLKSFDYKPRQNSSPNLVEWYPNFASNTIFANYGEGLFAQDEIQVVEHPVLASLREALLFQSKNDPRISPIVREGTTPFPILIRGVERRLSVDINQLYGSAQFATASKDLLMKAIQKLPTPTQTNLFCMEAPGNQTGEYTMWQLEYILKTAITTFYAVRMESYFVLKNKEKPIVLVHTGNWGTGAYGGNKTLMILMQLIAAALVKIDFLVYHTWKPEFEQHYQRAKSLMDKLFQDPQNHCPFILLNTLLSKKFKWEVSDGN